jgi:tetratricopeptide (TPR) repeat protein
MLLEEYAGASPKESLPKARAYIQKALEIDPLLGEAYAALGLINHYSNQFHEAESAFKRAIELDPNYPSAHQWYSGHLRDTGRIDEALGEIKRANELDPLSGIVGVNVGIGYVLKGDANAALSQLNSVIELDRNWWGGYTWLGLIYLKVGRNEDAVAILKKSLELNRNNRTMASSVTLWPWANGTKQRRS